MGEHGVYIRARIPLCFSLYDYTVWLLSVGPTMDMSLDNIKLPSINFGCLDPMLTLFWPTKSIYYGHCLG